MPRRQIVTKREVLPDPQYQDKTLAKFINRVMSDGKKSIAERIVYGALSQIESQNKDALEVFNQALENIAPTVEVKSRRVGGATYQIPVEVRASRRQALAMRWLVENARVRREQSMTQRLAAEILEASEGRGAAVKKREDIHKMADANQAYSHFRF